MHEQRTLNEVLAHATTRAPALAQEPATKLPPKPVQGPDSEQSPSHTAQRPPERAVDGLRPFRLRWQPLKVTLNYGVGDIMVRSNNGRLNDRTGAMFARAMLDGGHGAGLHAEWWNSDANLFSGKFMSDGVAPNVADAELGGVDLFPHARFEYQYGDWNVPVRIGLFADWQQLDHQQARVEREWLSFGPRILVEPTQMLLQSDTGSLHLFARIGVDIGAAWFSEEFRNGDDKDMTPRWAGEIGGGLRGTYGAWHAELSYRLHHTTYGETQGDLFGNPGRTELQRQQVFFGIGYTY
jgi:hypothetical protein